MRRVYKSKAGFTLAEMVLVIAIIVILAAALALNVADWLNTSKEAESRVNASAAAVSKDAATSEAMLKSYGF